jgi:hypothetical protein
MPSFQLPPDSFFDYQDGETKRRAITKSAFDKFNPSVLGLGDITRESVQKTAVVALFDLQDFTNFCKQMDPQLSVPIYLSGFLSWIFSESEWKRSKRSALTAC